MSEAEARTRSSKTPDPDLCPLRYSGPASPPTFLLPCGCVRDEMQVSR